MAHDHTTRQSIPRASEAAASAVAATPGKRTLSEPVGEPDAPVQLRATASGGGMTPPAVPDAGGTHAVVSDGVRDPGGEPARLGRIDRLFGRHGDSAPAAAPGATRSGEALPAPMRGKFESSLGVDLSGVRVHTDPESASAASAAGAKAYTIGQDIHFGSGQYAPSSASGEHLLAHEVAHTVQQRGQAPRQQNKLSVSSPGDRSESEADAAASAMLAGRPATVSAVPVMVSRQPATPATPGLSDADKIAKLASASVGQKAVNAINYRIGMAQLRSQGKEMQFQPSLIDRADGAIRKQFGSVLPAGRDYAKAFRDPKDASNTKDPKNAQSVRALDPDAIAKLVVPDGDQQKAALVLAKIVMETSSDVMTELSIKDPADPILQTNVVSPLFQSNTVTIALLQNYEKNTLGGYTRFSTASDGSTNVAVALPTKARNLGHITVHEAMHFYVHDDYRKAANSRSDSDKLMEGGAEYLARIVIQAQLLGDPDFEINYSTYSGGFSYINSLGTKDTVGFPVAYFSGRTDMMPPEPAAG